MCGLKAASTADFSTPPIKKVSSIITSQARKVRITRSCAGEARAVTNAVRIGEAVLSDLKWVCIKASAFKTGAKGPAFNGLSAFLRSCSSNASMPCY